MGIPALDAEGLLPQGRHPATLNEVYERFVEDAPNRSRRELVFAALRVELQLLVQFGGPSTVWLDGGFVTHKAAAPHDADIVYLCRDDQHMLDMLATDGIYEVLTLQGVAAWKPVSVAIRRLQPVGGLVDTFLARPARFGYWHALWESVKGADGTVVPGRTKGYLEVIL